jgi:uncharacterized protein YjgD (DUF1641 family)
MRKMVWVVMMVLLSAAMVSCGGKYDEVESTLTDYADAMEDYVTRMDRAESSDAVVEAMQDYTEKIKSLAPRLKEMNEKFPELASGKAFPKELEKISRRMEDMGQKVQTAMMKTMKYMVDPDVQKALTEQSQAMAQAAQ